MHDKPDPVALLECVVRTIREDLLPDLSDAAAYQARVAASVVAIVVRQLRQQTADDEIERASLQNILGMDGQVATLNRELARRIATREININRADVADHLWTTTLAKLNVDQPTFAELDHQNVRRRL